MPVARACPYISTRAWPPSTSGPVAAAMIPLVAELEAAAAAGELTADGWSEGFDSAIAALRGIDDNEERGAWLEPLFGLGEPFGFVRE